jgi:hypothetical protein
MVAVYVAASPTVGVPAIVAVPFWLSTKLRPLGRPEALMVGVAVLHVVTVKLNDVPTTAVAESWLVTTGGSQVTALAEADCLGIIEGRMIVTHMSARLKIRG